MNRTIVFSAALAGTLLAAGGLQAQSDTDGFMLGVHLVGSGITPAGSDTETEAGGGLGLQVGYGFNDRITLYLNVDAADVAYEDEDEGESYTLATADLGLRVNFGNAGMKLRPWLNAAFTGVAAVDEVEVLNEEIETTVSGGGITIGGGVQYFFSPSLALDAGLLATAASFTDVDVDGESEELEMGIGFTHSRLQLGVTWHP